MSIKFDRSLEMQKLKKMTDFKEHPTILSKANFTFLTANLVMDKDKEGANPFNISNGFCLNGFFTIAKMKIPDGMAIAFGTRKQKTPLYCRVDEAGGEIEGRFKIVGAHPSGYPMVDLGTFHTSVMDSSATRSNRTNPTPKLVTPWILDKGYILVAFKPDIDDKTLVYDDANNTLHIPITKKMGLTRARMRR